MWYRALVENINAADEIEARLDLKLKQPVLMITSKPTRLNPPGVADMMKSYVENLTVKELSAEGHWGQLEARDEFNETLLGFYEGL